MSLRFSSAETEARQHLTSEPPATPADGLGTRRLTGRWPGRRRTYLVSPRYQIRTAIIAVLGMTFVLGVAAGLLNLLHVGQGAPLRDGTGWAYFLVAAGVALVIAAFLIEILETHRTAGVVLRVVRGLRALETGAWGTRLNLRKHDNFKELEKSFNASARSLCDRAEEEILWLDSIASRIDLSVRELEAGHHPGVLALLRQMEREMEEVRKRRGELLRAPGEVRFDPRM